MRRAIIRRTLAPAQPRANTRPRDQRNQHNQRGALPIAAQAPTRPYKTPPQKRQWLGSHPHLRRFLYILQFPAILFGSLIAGIMVQSVIVGQSILLIYAICTLIFRIDSRTTFLMAFFLLCSLIALLIFRSNNALAVNFAVYSFILLLIGVVSLLRELRERYV
jgi:hypothetical protein